MLENGEERFLPISEEIYRELKRKIVLGEYKAGERLKERNIAEEMKISRTPIREAFVRLENEALLVNYPRRGVVVKGISQEDVVEVYSIRKAIECLAIEFAIEHITENEVKELKRINNEMQELLNPEENQSDMEKVRGLSARFNMVLNRACRMPRLIREIEMYSGYMDNIKEFFMMDRKRWEKDLVDHVLIVEAVEEKDKSLAAALVKKHIEYGMKQVLEEMRKRNTVESI